MKLWKNPTDDPKEKIVVNTSPWIALSICGQTELLKKLYEEVYIPVSVREEILRGGEEMIGVAEMKRSPWLKVERVTDVEKVKLLYELDPGEAEVIVLAKEKGVKQVLVDEKIARMQAKIIGLEVLGTLGLLLKAKKRGLLPEIKPSMERMLKGGFWVEEEIVRGILTEAGEI